MHPVAALARVPAWPRRPEFLLTGALAAWALAEALLTRPVTPAAVAVALVWSLPVLLVRTAPVAGLAVVCAALVLVGLTAQELAGAMPFPAVLTLTFGAGLWIASPGWSGVAALTALASVIAVQSSGYYGVDAPGQVIVTMFFVGGAWLAGRMIRRHAEQVRLAQQEARVSAAAAVADERARIAHELHDVVAHAVSVIAVQAGAAADLLDRHPERARAHLAHVRTGAQEAMTEMRRLLEVLDEAPADRDPLPSIGRVEELVGQTRAAGVDVSLQRTGPEAELPTAVELAGYRVLQEALTNVRRHAPGGRAEVSVHRHPDRVELVVTSHACSEPPPGPSPGGRGLAGMAERVRVFGGELRAGPDPDGGFTVRAVLPRGRT